MPWPYNTARLAASLVWPHRPFGGINAGEDNCPLPTTGDAPRLTIRSDEDLPGTIPRLIEVQPSTFLVGRHSFPVFWRHCEAVLLSVRGDISN